MNTTRTMHRTIVTTVAGTIAAIATATAFAADTVALRASVRVPMGDAVELGEIAALYGVAERFASLEIARADAGAFEIAVDAVRQKLAAAGADLRAIRLVGEKTVVRPTRATVQAPATPAEPIVRVRTAMSLDHGPRTTLLEPARYAGEATPIGIATGLVANAFGDDLDAVRLEVRDDDLAKLAPKAGLRYEIVAKTALRIDRVDLEVVAYEGTKLISRERIRFEPRIEREVCVARCALRRGDTIDASNSVIETRFIPPSISERAADAGTCVGSTVAASIADGEVVAADDIQQPLAVRRNERVMVRREIGMVAIEFEALALEDGSTGDVIAVEQAGKGRRRDVRALTAEVVAPGRAVIR
ncbi:MAG: flagellar basal body P-ring formation chaperone FlgA [bacterium]